MFYFIPGFFDIILRVASYTKPFMSICGLRAQVHVVMVSYIGLRFLLLGSGSLLKVIQKRIIAVLHCNKELCSEMFVGYPSKASHTCSIVTFQSSAHSNHRCPAFPASQRAYLDVTLTPAKYRMLVPRDAIRSTQLRPSYVQIMQALNFLFRLRIVCQLW